MLANFQWSSSTGKPRMTQVSFVKTTESNQFKPPSNFIAGRLFLLIWIIVGQGPIVLAVGVGEG